MEIVSNVRVGKPDVKPNAPTHVRGVREGNAWSWLKRRLRIAVATPRRSTGIDASGRKPIDPRMPVLTPA